MIKTKIKAVNRNQTILTQEEKETEFFNSAQFNVLPYKRDLLIQDFILFISWN